MKDIRVRYAPSPTGFLHIGNARTALFNYLFARHCKGKFLIRIEDTDLARNVKNSEVIQLEQLKWLGIDWDEGPGHAGPFGPYRQSERLSIYKKYTQILLEKKLAYKEFQRNNDKFVVRFKVPPFINYNFNDIIRGSVCFDSSHIEDWIIMKENGYPTYNYAVSIDDYLMKISHVLRGEEHITNTPKQIMIYQSFGWKVPIFGHFSLILNKNKKKLSKRDDENFHLIKRYISLGYLPQALFNFLVLLGFSPKNNKTILLPEEIIDLFDIKRISPSPAIFDEQKLFFINNQYLQKISFSELVAKAKEFFEKRNIFLKYAKLEKVVTLFRSRINYIDEIVDLYIEFFVKDEIEEEVFSFLRDKKNFNFIQILNDLFMSLKYFDSISIKELFNKFSELTLLKGKELFSTLRIICTRKLHGPSLIISLEILGKEKILDNIQKNLNHTVCK
ncbi:MAG: glutamate--tRNA ligase [Candidatus Phytoplasma stylosanthis]|uniref:glutamate--tRNA ligase n=1 Tax=Candidatus Phytoplasma stylosanthis TaxID=2798314 RepID=UPI002939E137|nr:glutamate--tRNA ligase [Candidatus Phytoplasma stylosanthis]MDV3167781.1 glutamate--tRNA ligase [Candidatus Phytoplasma stylosanthis]MDV3170942.1 glutamate--tRNA ligase [Candidatus Phytoplasma stylosanthis]MDV3173686.1 glutamate--tRNA ligase [Candidatus Phytoplasma stylosanthis]MDV3174114.1 glutamate--tRNA ligase [Candidatus Phytoplasma stylosanthis]MDV3202366.1 glutamate--tRNA ligase [Candidatus Phytoplasma stylosanthis]